MSLKELEDMLPSLYLIQTKTVQNGAKVKTIDKAYFKKAKTGNEHEWPQTNLSSLYQYYFKVKLLQSTSNVDIFRMKRGRGWNFPQQDTD